MIARPQSVPSGNRTYQVKIDPNLQLREGLEGCCDHQKLVILLLPRYYSSQLDESFWHETTHAINAVYLNGKLSEDEVGRIAQGLSQALQSIGIIFEWESEAIRKD